MNEQANETVSNQKVARRTDAMLMVGIFVVAFALRLAAALKLAAEPVWDGQYYDFGAKRIAAGLGYSDDRFVDGHAIWHPWCHYPVGYSAYLSVFYNIFGPTPLAAHVANGIAGALLAVFTFLLAREALSPLRALVAGTLVALDPGLVLYGALVMTEPLSALLVLAAFWVALRVKRSRLGDGLETPSRKRWAALLRGPAAGAFVLGIAALVRPQALLSAPFLALAANVLPSTGSGMRARFAAAIAACAIAVATVLPWTLRNCRVMDGCALISTNAGWNLAIGAFPRATGRFETLRSSDGCREVTGQVQQDRCWLHYGLSHIRQAPMRWLGLVPAKLSYTFDHESFAVEYLHEARPAAWPEPRRTAAREFLTTTHRALVSIAPFAFVGIVRPRRRRQKASGDEGGSLRGFIVQSTLFVALAALAYASFTASTPTFSAMVVVGCVLPWLPLPGRPKPSPALLLPVALLATTVVAHAIFFGEDRYHMVVSPVLCLLAAAALRRGA
ncbi:MAG: glycosyltransferase family 39 protein [Polyangiaceae bacterium]|nr:glycosyltransferase family 39 protein [Polyangiaceae bacterium]